MTLTTLQTAEHAFAAEVERIFADRSPVVCFANDWKGDPTSKHHIMRMLARSADVLWVESSGMRRPRMTNPLDAKRAFARLRRSFHGLRPQVEEAGADRLFVLSPLSVPLPGNPLATRLNAALYGRSIRRSMGALGTSRRPLNWVYIPTVAPYLSHLPEGGLVYHCVDRWWAFQEYDTELMRACHATLCERADLVIASSTALLQDCLEHTDRAYLIPHGVEWAHFSRAAFDPPPAPADVADLRGPVLGFFGLIHEWVDVELIARLAERFPHTTVVLIGKVQTDVSRLSGIPNVRFLGQKAYAELPAYSAHFDVGLIPFHQNDLTLAVNPIKLREYLSAGMPVVATALPDILTLADNPMLLTASSREQFADAVETALALPGGAGARRAAAAAMVTDSWPGRCAEIARLVETHVPR